MKYPSLLGQLRFLNIQELSQGARSVVLLWTPIKYLGSAHCFPSESKLYHVKVSVAVLTYLKQNVLHTCCSLKSSIIWRNKNQRRHKAQSHDSMSQRHKLEFWNKQQMTSEILTYLHQVEEFSTNCSSITLWQVQKLYNHTLYLHGFMTWSIKYVKEIQFHRWVKLH